MLRYMSFIIEAIDHSNVNCHQRFLNWFNTVEILQHYKRFENPKRYGVSDDVLMNAYLRDLHYFQDYTGSKLHK